MKLREARETTVDYWSNDKGHTYRVGDYLKVAGTRFKINRIFYERSYFSWFGPGKDPFPEHAELELELPSGKLKYMVISSHGKNDKLTDKKFT